MKAKYPKPYVDIPQKDGTVIRGYGAPADLELYMKADGNGQRKWIEYWNNGSNGSSVIDNDSDNDRDDDDDDDDYEFEIICVV